MTVDGSKDFITKWCAKKEELHAFRYGSDDDGASEPFNILLGDALLTTAYILNWVLSKFVTYTPYKL